MSNVFGSPQASSAQSALVEYCVVMERNSHNENVTPTGTMTIRIPAIASIEPLITIPCTAGLEWCSWVAAFNCTHEPTNDRFDNFQGTSLAETLEPSLNFSGEVVCGRLNQVDENGHEFLEVFLHFENKGSVNPEDEVHFYHNLWLKRVQGSGETKLTPDEMSRLGFVVDSNLELSCRATSAEEDDQASREQEEVGIEAPKREETGTGQDS